ncbi:MAG: DUF2341 domain-containing protein, partial [Thermoplasmata archaeon]
MNSLNRGNSFAALLITNLLIAGLASAAWTLEELGEGSGAGAREFTPWWNLQWLFRRPVTISNTAGSQELSKYQVLIKVTYDSDMKSDFSDLRFVRYDSSSDQHIELPYYLEKKVDGIGANFTVRVDKIPRASETTIYMYYGNPAASSNSSGEATFEFFDDFEDGDVSDWVITNGDGINKADSTAPYQGSYSHFVDAGSADLRVKKSINPPVSVPYVFEVMAMDTSAYMAHKPVGGGSWEILHRRDDGGRYKPECFFGGTLYTGLGSMDFDLNKWYHLKIIHTANQAWFSWEGGTYGPYSDTLTPLTDIQFTAQNYAKGAGYQDLMIIRKYAQPEPEVRIGDEENAIRFLSFTVSSGVIDEGDCVWLNATFENPAPLSLEIPVSFHDGADFQTSSLIHSERLTLPPSGERVFSYLWYPTGGPHTVWVAQMGSPLASRELYVNRYPVLSPIMDQVASQGKNFKLLIFAEDADGDRLNWSEDCPLFDIIPRGEQSAEINFTPTNDDVGNYTVNITVSDPRGCKDSTRFKLTV